MSFLNVMLSFMGVMMLAIMIFLSSVLTLAPEPAKKRCGMDRCVPDANDGTSSSSKLTHLPDTAKPTSAMRSIILERTYKP